ncbi:single-stranded DNA-binding protein [Sutcliffiella rhizosphaerae]|uniref:Single-stranded DNA-binding protein n=1 Tax=Sutcliffiella rhizosphaerae TaxID=2880967 RepID=A0ABM8YN33_9BACI|nr:single-stranded DNA-binding protein [Sutcliffiella rhizosphaerae]CAG9621381.1 Single-stranded DNA-binding protein [Sutcliffiella rhizosphaerae]
MINEVVLVGRMVRDPELRYTNEGTAIASFRLAVNRTFKNQEGIFEADFVSCTAWRNLAETTANYCRKGSLVGVTGRIQTRKYEAKDGTTVFVTDIVVDNVRFLEKKRDEKHKTSKSEEQSNSVRNDFTTSPPQAREYPPSQFAQNRHEARAQTSDFRSMQENVPPSPGAPDKIGV